MKNVLVTGATGFIGSNLAIALVRGGYRVRILRRQNSDLRAIGNADVEHAIGDIRDKEAVRRAVKGCDTVFHAAALVSYWKRRRQEMYDINIGGTRAIVSACLELGIERFIHTSSIAAIGFAGNGVLADESTSFNWDRYDVGYRISKYRAEQEILQGIRKGLPATIVNPSVVIGERDIHFNGGQIIRDIYKKRVFYSLEGGISVAYVGDVVAGHLAAARQGRIGERYILCGDNLTHTEVVSMTAEVVGGIKPLVKLPMWFTRTLALGAETVGNVTNSKPWISTELVAGMNFRCWYSAVKAERELGYTITPFREAVRRTFEWYRMQNFL